MQSKKLNRRPKFKFILLSTIEFFGCNWTYCLASTIIRSFLQWTRKHFIVPTARTTMRLSIKHTKIGLRFSTKNFCSKFLPSINFRKIKFTMRQKTSFLVHRNYHHMKVNVIQGFQLEKKLRVRISVSVWIFCLRLHFLPSFEFCMIKLTENQKSSSLQFCKHYHTDVKGIQKIQS